jgi:hypothetical protein
MTVMRGFPRWKKPGQNPAVSAPQAEPATVTPSADVIEPPPAVPVSQAPTASSSAHTEAEYDEDGRMLITTPLVPMPRPVPRIMHPKPVSRHPVLPPEGGLLAGYLAQRAAEPPRPYAKRRHMPFRQPVPHIPPSRSRLLLRLLPSRWLGPCPRPCFRRQHR